MIRINLLAREKRKKKKEVGSKGSWGAIFVVVLVMEILGLYFWGQAEQGRLDEKSRVLQKLETELKEFESLTKQQQELQTKIDEEENQAKIFETLKNGRIGAANLLLYLSYILTKPAVENRDERVVQEQLGWTSGWDTERAWFTALKNSGKGSLVISGEALTHKDTDEVLKRLRCTVYFQGLRLVHSTKKRSREAAPDIIAFQFEATINYDPEAGKEKEDEAGSEKKDLKPAAAKPPAGKG